MRRPLACTGLLLLAVLASPAPLRADEPDPVRAEYDRVVAASKAKQWDETRARAEAFLAAHPDFVHAHSALYLHALASSFLRRFEDVVADADRYAATFPGRPYEDRLALLRGQAHFKLRRASEARKAFEAVVAKGSKSAGEARGWLARIDPKDATVRGNVVLDYTGKYEGDPRLLPALASVEKAVPVALARARARLGLEGAPPPFRVRFRDTGERRDTMWMQTSEELHGETVVQAVVVRTEALLGRTVDVPTSLTHELVHVHHRAGLGEAYYEVPRWVREGLAIWVAEQGPWHLAAAYNQSAPSLSTGDPAAKMVNGLAGAHGIDDYPEDYLAFAWIEATKGPAAAKALARRLLTTPDAEGAFGAAAGVPFPEAAARARAFAEARVRKDLEGSGPYAQARALFAAGKHAEAASAYEAFLASAPSHPLAPRARSDRALSLFRAGRFDDAAAAFDVLEGTTLVELFRDEVAEHRVRLAAAREDGPAVLATAQVFLRDYSWVDGKRLDAVRALRAKFAPPSGSAPAAPPPEPPAEAPDDE